ncbi:MAG: hypothetical protein COB78_13470 [Hyphomicrobiales bacterium]|nr:MAG: hypothetical protein COB78_13470 [Hyphomicrobiales bacterium]
MKTAATPDMKMPDSTIAGIGDTEGTPELPMIDQESIVKTAGDRRCVSPVLTLTAASGKHLSPPTAEALIKMAQAARKQLEASL